VQGKQGTKHKAIKKTIRIGAFLVISFEFITIALCAFAEEENFEPLLAELLECTNQFGERCLRRSM